MKETYSRTAWTELHMTKGLTLNAIDFSTEVKLLRFKNSNLHT